MKSQKQAIAIALSKARKKGKKAPKLKEEDKKKLTTLFIDEKSVKKFSGPKRCGGFHPDFCVEWHVGKDVYRAHICFGCHEMMVYGPKSDLYCDIAEPAYKELDALLKTYRKNRPKRD